MAITMTCPKCGVRTAITPLGLDRFSVIYDSEVSKACKETTKGAKSECPTLEREAAQVFDRMMGRDSATS